MKKLSIVLMLGLFVAIVDSSCSKKDVTTPTVNEPKSLFIRIEAVQDGGSPIYSKVLRVR